MLAGPGVDCVVGWIQIINKKTKKQKKGIDAVEQVCYNVCLFRTGRGFEKKEAVGEKSC
jgi:hypothetical protein